MNTARIYLAGCGTQTSALGFGGTSSGDTESWNGTNWTEVANLSAGVNNAGGAGTSNTSALNFGGGLPSGAVQAATEEWTFTGGVSTIETS